ARISQGYVMSLLNLDLIEAIYSDAERELTMMSYIGRYSPAFQFQIMISIKKKNSVGRCAA
ncbi:hypothetical protein, partial [Klebsiella pneumoniae]|uniref:hypothetical protein n=1 Tax=Klebsiella pneumoniae TaxID=573 RepID=UPI001D193981